MLDHPQQLPQGHETGVQAAHRGVCPAEGDEPHIGKLLDMTMLAVTGGEERTASEYKVLLARAGLKINRVIPTGSDVSIVEAELLDH